MTFVNSIENLQKSYSKPTIPPKKLDRFSGYSNAFSAKAFSANAFSPNISSTFTANYSQSIVNTNIFFSYF